MRRFVAAAFAAAMIAGLAVGASGHTLQGGPSICPLLVVTGIACPFCGMTRATVAIGAGDFARACALHPLAPFVLLAMFAVAGSIALGRDRWLVRSPKLVLAAILGVWAVKLLA